MQAVRHVTAGPPQDLEIELLLEAIFRRYHYDFRRYSIGAIRRRLHSALPALGCDTVSTLQGRVLHDPSVFLHLLHFLTVQVSDLFRDPGYFRVLRERIAPVLSTYPSPRIWVAGCATGEEAYSIAILLREAGLLERSRIYATDIGADGLRRAEEGAYPASRLPVFAENHAASGVAGRLEDHFSLRRDLAVFDPVLRRRIVFSEHSLVTDGVFAEVQLVSCRNVLIYFDQTLQERAIRLFHDALCRRGFLGLGAKETLGGQSPHAAAFEELCRGARWYRRVT